MGFKKTHFDKVELGALECFAKEPFITYGGLAEKFITFLLIFSLEEISNVISVISLGSFRSENFKWF
jgi:hypothetical protein